MFYSKASYKYKLVLFFLVSMLAMSFIIGFFLMKFTNHIHNQKNSENLAHTMDDSKSAINGFLTKLDLISEIALNDISIISYLSEPSEENCTSTTNKLAILADKSEDIQDIFIISFVNRCLISSHNSNLKDHMLFEALTKQTQSKKYNKLTSPYINPLTGNYVISHITQIIENNVPIGAIVINIDLNFDFLKSNDFKIYILDEDNTLLNIGHFDLKVPIKMDIINSSIKNIKYVPISSYNDTVWLLVVSHSYEKITKERNSAIIFIFISLIGFALISSGLFSLIFFFILKPLDKIEDGLNEISEGDFSIITPPYKLHPLNSCINSINKSKLMLENQVCNFSQVSKTIHQSTTVLSDDSQNSVSAIEDVNYIIQKLSANAYSQVDYMHNSIVLAQAIGNKLDDFLKASNEIQKKFHLSNEKIRTANEKMDILIQNSVVLELVSRNTIDHFKRLQKNVNLALKNLEDTDHDFFQIHNNKQALSNIEKNISELEICLEDYSKISKSFYDSLETVFNCCTSVEDINKNVNFDILELIRGFKIITRRKNGIIKALETLKKEAQINSDLFEDVVKAIELHSQAMKDIEHQITTLYRTSLDLNNQIEGFKAKR